MESFGIELFASHVSDISVPHIQPHSVRRYIVFVTYIPYKTILGQRFWSEANNKGTMRSAGGAFASFRLRTALRVQSAFWIAQQISIRFQNHFDFFVRNIRK